MNASPPSKSPGAPSFSESPCTRLERALLLAILGFYALFIPLTVTLIRPGFYRFDEEGLVDQIQIFREGRPLAWGIGWSSLYKWVCVALVSLGGPHLFLLHLPTYAAVLLEAPLLYAWLKPKAGERAALWAVLANMVAVLTFVRGVSLLGCGLLPFTFLVGVLACERGLDAFPSFGVGFALAVMLLDYEGWVAALLFLVPYAVWLRRGKPAALAAGSAGFVLGAAVALAVSPDFLGKLAARGAISHQLSPFGQIKSNVTGLVLPSDRLLFADAPYHSWPSPWIWLPACLGIAISVRKHPGLLWLLVCGAAPLVMKGTSIEPQRLSLAYLGLCAMAGVGFARLWRARRGPLLCLLLFTFGVVDECWAWNAVPAATTQAYYGESQGWESAAVWLKDHQGPGGWRLISGLGTNNDAALRFLADGAGVRPGGAVPVALIHASFRPALATLESPETVVIGSTRPLILCFPSKGDTQRLEAVEASLDRLHWIQATAAVPELLEASREWLQSPEHTDPWGRSVAWYLWLNSSMFMGQVEPAGIQAMLTDSLVSAKAPNEFADVFQVPHPGVARCFSDKAADIDPALLNLSLKERADLY